MASEEEIIPLLSFSVMDIQFKILDNSEHAKCNPLEGIIYINGLKVNEDNIVDTIVHESIHYILYKIDEWVAYYSYDIVSYMVEDPELIPFEIEKKHTIFDLFTQLFLNINC